jgi:hypothetical protein
MNSATPEMRRISHSNGGSHSPDYWEFHDSQILFTNVDRSNTISVKIEATTTLIDTIFWFVALSTSRASLRSIPLILQLNLHTQPFGFVGEHLSSLPIYHLMDLLIRLFAVINRLSNVPNVANYKSLHSSIVESGDKFCCLFVLNVPNLVV